MHLPGKITYKVSLTNRIKITPNAVFDDLFWDQEIDEMIETVDRNEDWKISYSEFRVNVLFSSIRVYVFSMIEQKNNF
jgi:hypothetical protein